MRLIKIIVLTSAFFFLVGGQDIRSSIFLMRDLEAPADFGFFVLVSVGVAPTSVASSRSVAVWPSPSSCSPSSCSPVGSISGSTSGESISMI